MYETDRLYVEGDEGKAADYEQATFWFRKAVEKKHPEAAFELAQLYVTANLDEKVRSVGIQFFKLAAKSNYLASVNKLIDIYCEGILVQHDSKQLTKWKEKQDGIKKILCM